MRINAIQPIQTIGGTVGGTAESVRGTVDVRYADFATLYIDYVKGSEGTLYVYPKFQHTSGGTPYAWADFGTSLGDVSPTAMRLKYTANASGYHTFDVRGISYMSVWTMVVGTPTGGLGLTLVTEE